MAIYDQMVRPRRALRPRETPIELPCRLALSMAAVLVLTGARYVATGILAVSRAAPMNGEGIEKSDEAPFPSCL